MANLKWFASLVVAVGVVSTVSAETHCPGNVASITPRIVQGALIVIPVKINDAGPFDFMVDIRSQIRLAVCRCLRGALRSASRIASMKPDTAAILTAGRSVF